MSYQLTLEYLFDEYLKDKTIKIFSDCGNRLAANAGFIDKNAGEYLSSLNVEKIKECLEKISISMLQNAHDIWVNRCILYDQDNTKSAGGKWYNNLKQNRHDRYKFIIKHSTVTEEG